MRSLIVTEMGSSLHLSNNLLQVREKGDVVAEYPLNRLRNVQIIGKGVSVSTNLLVELSSRGIPLFIIDFRGRPAVSISGNHLHAVGILREKQILYRRQKEAEHVARSIIRGKINNQRSVLLYFAKGLRKNKSDLTEILEKAATQLRALSRQLLKPYQEEEREKWQNYYLGIEGRAAAIYWGSLRNAELLPSSFKGRYGRGATDVTNQSLNLGYAILMSYVWNAITVAGLEPYLGILHAERPGKPSLVLDLMEEYRPWVVDRNIIKLRFQMQNFTHFHPELKKNVIASIHQTMTTKMYYQKKRIRLSAILQRQVYKLCGVLHSGKKYKPYIFHW